MQIYAGRSKTLRAADVAMRGDKRVMLVVQRQPQVNDPTADDLYQIGTVANVIEESELRKGAEPSVADTMPAPNAPGGTRRILVKGIARARVDMLYAEDYVSAHVTVLNDNQAQDRGDLQLLRTAVMTRFGQYAERTGWPPKAWKAPPRADILGMFSGFDIGQFADTIAAHIPLQLAQKQEVLEILDVRKRLEYLDVATSKLEQAGPEPTK
jgi:ATP-dependent Lon protease